MPEERDRGGRDVAISLIAGRQHGIITGRQLIANGIGTSTISDRVAAGRLHRIHRGVYAVGHRRLSNEGRWMAAVLACGKGAVLSHGSAAELWGMLHRRRVSGAGGGAALLVEVMVAGTAGKRKRKGIQLHRSPTLTAAQCTRRDGIPVTTPARTLADLRRVLPSVEFNRAVREAEFLRLPLRNGSTHEGESLESDRARSRLEARFLAVCRRHCVPQPDVNVAIDRYEVDFLWPDTNLIVEVDGWMSHGTRSAFEQDRARDGRLAVLGFQVLRFTWRQVTSDPEQVAATIRSVLTARS